MTVDDDAMRYLALAAEARVRALLASAVRAQEHRVNSTYKHQPPMSKEAAGRPAKPLWSQRITSDPNAVMQALMAANKEENKAHRVARTERNARETEMARAAAAAREREEAAGGSAPSPAVETNSPDERPSPGGAGSGASSAGSKPKEPTFQAAPTFGAPPPKKTGKGKKAASRDVSADVQAKMTNIAASLATGRKKYAWQSGGSGAFRPQVPSLLSGKRKAAEAVEVEAEKTDSKAEVKAKKPKRTISAPHRRDVDVEKKGDKAAKDDTALTLVDMAFALAHDGSGRGMGTPDQIAHKIWSQPGGPYGRWS